MTAPSASLINKVQIGAAQNPGVSSVSQIGNFSTWNTERNTTTVWIDQTSKSVREVIFSSNGANQDCGAGWDLSSAVDFAANPRRCLLLHVQHNDTRGNQNFDSSLIRGTKVYAIDASNNYKAFLVGGPTSPLTIEDVWYGVVVFPAATAQETSGTLNQAAIDRVEWSFDKNSVLQGGGFFFYEWLYFDGIQVTGGEAGNYANLETLFNAFNGIYLLVGKKAFDRNVYEIPAYVELGNGSTAFNWEDTNERILVQPGGVDSDSLSAKYATYHYPDLAVGIRVRPNGGRFIHRGQFRTRRRCFLTFENANSATTSLIIATANYNLSFGGGWDVSDSDFLGSDEITTTNSNSFSQTKIRQSIGAAALTLRISDTFANVLISNSTNAGIRISTNGDYSAKDIEVLNSGTYDVYIDATVTSGQTVDISGLIFTSGSTTPTNVFWAGTSGAITVIVGQAGLTTATAGGSITLVEPLAALNAANFEDDIRVYTARYQTFIINSADINTTTDQITLGTDSETGSSFAGQITTPATLAYLVAASGATLPTSTPQIATNRLYYIVANSSGVVQISETEGGSAINFSSTGTESGGYLFSLTCSTELSNELISGGSGFSAAYTLPDGALIEVAAQGIATDESTATTLFHRIVEWSSTAGASVADTFSLANNPDAIYGQLIGSTITSKRGVAITVTSEPSSVLGITFDLSGNIELDANAITDSTLYAPDAYVWSIYQRYTEDGIRFIRNQFEALSIMEFDFNGVLTIDNIADGARNSPATPLIVLGNLYTSAESIYAANSGTIRVEPFFVSDLTSAGDGSFTSGDRMQLDELYATLESAGVFSEAALANAPAGGGGGTPDWTADEKSQIRYRLGIDGTEAAPSTNTPELGTIDANVVSFEVDVIDADAIASSAIDEIQDGLSTLTAQQVWEYSTRTLSSFGTLVADTVTAVWAAATRSLTDKAGFSLDPDQSAVTIGTTTTNTDMRGTDNALLADNYTAPANSSIADILEDTGTTIPTTLATIDALIDSIKAKTDQLAFTVANQVDANALTGGGGDNAATIYSYFTALDREDAFKADVSGLSTLTTADIPSAGTIAGAVQNELDDDFATLANILADIPDDVAAQTAIAAMLARIIKMAKARGMEPGVTASQLDPTAEAPGFLTTSDGAVDQTLIANGDGSTTISSN